MTNKFILLVLLVLLIPFSTALVSINNGGSQRLTINPGIIEGFPFTPGTSVSPPGQGTGVKFRFTEANIQSVCSIAEEFVENHTTKRGFFFSSEEINPLYELLKIDYPGLTTDELKRALERCAIEKPGFDKLFIFLFLILVIAIILVLFIQRKRISHFLLVSDKSSSQA